MGSEPWFVVTTWMPEATVVGIDQQPHYPVPGLLRQERAGALVVNSDALTHPLLALDQTPLPLWISLPNVVPEPGKIRKITAIERLRELARDRPDITQMINEQLSLTPDVRRVGIRWCPLWLSWLVHHPRPDPT